MSAAEVIWEMAAWSGERHLPPSARSVSAADVPHRPAQMDTAPLLPHKRSLFPSNPVGHPDSAGPMILAVPRTHAARPPRRWRSVTVSPHNLFTLKLRAKAALNKCQPPHVGKQFQALVKFQRAAARGEPGTPAPLHRFHFGNGTLDKWTVSRR